MFRFRWLWLLLTAASSGIGADPWQLIRFEGRDYIPLDNIATFYGFPAPPLIEPEPAGTEAPAEPVPDATPAEEPTAEEPAKPEEAAKDTAPTKPEEPAPVQAPQSVPLSTALKQAIENATPIAPAPLAGHVRADTQIVPVAMGAQRSKTVSLDNGHAKLSVTANSRIATINGVRQWLSFAPILQDGKILISRMDLSKTIEPRLRPERIENLSPVRTVVIDAGHGGHDKGAASRFGYEKDFSLDVAKRVKEKLERRGMKVIMTRTSDIFIPLHERPRVANHIQDSIFVSIHFNSASSNPLARGFEVYSIPPRGAPATNDGKLTVRALREEAANAVEVPSTALASSVLHSMLGNVPMEDRGLKHARFAVLRLCTKPSILIECGFLSNGPESALAGTPVWRQKLADSIAVGIEGYKELAEERHAPKVLAHYQAQQAGEAPAPAPLTPAVVEPPPQQN